MEIPLVGFLYLKESGRHAVEPAVLGVLKEYHRHGVGRSLFLKSKAEARRLGYSFIRVKTVQMGKYRIYDNTNCFYISLGFKELEVFTTLWDECNPRQIYIAEASKFPHCSFYIFWQKDPLTKLVLIFNR